MDGMIATLISWTLAASTWPLRASLRFLLHLRVGRQVLLELELGGDRTTGSRIDDTVSMRVALREAVEDKRVVGVLLKLRPLGGGWSSLGELRDGLSAMQAAGKKVIVHLDVASLRELYLVSGADGIWLTPSSQLLLGGLGAGLSFYGDLLDRVGARADLEAAGAFKSFGEPYTRSWPSRPNREQLHALLSDLQEQVVSSLCSDRDLERDAVMELLGLSPLSAEEALERGLVDGLAYADEVDKALEEALGESCRRVDFYFYARFQAAKAWLEAIGRRGARLVVVHLEGPVVHGAEGMGGSGYRIDADRVMPVLDQLAEQDDVRGVLVYVDSPGGSALASDIIARGVERLGEKKPVVALFGDVSASGGYYLSAPAAEVVARPDVITGSIGVVGGKIVLGEGLGRVGVHHEVVAVGPDPGMFSPWSAFTDDQRTRFRASLERTYARFLDIVAKGRGTTPEAIEPHAQGRVWTGRQAHERGLVDTLGGLEVALARLRSRAELGDGEGHVLHVRFSPPRWRVLASLAGRGSLAKVARGILPELALPPFLAMVRAAPGRALAMLPWTLD